MRTCQRCGNEVSWTQDTVGLFGGVYAHLCVHCRTDWYTYVCTTDVWQDVLRNDARQHYLEGRAWGQQPPTEDDWYALRAQKDAIEAQAHALGKAFVEERITREVSTQ